jgi:tetratricopeptide (TPR) repeat protein
VSDAIPTTHRLEYAKGYLALGLLPEAAEELAAIGPDDRQTADVLEVRTALHMETKQWALAAALAARLTTVRPGDPQSWISWAFATRRYKGIAAAEPILIEAEQRFGHSCALIHYNLACYRCQSGDLKEAARRLGVALRLDPNWRSIALGDTDLEPLWPQIRQLPQHN